MKEINEFTVTEVLKAVEKALGGHYLNDFVVSMVVLYDLKDVYGEDDLMTKVVGWKLMEDILEFFEPEDLHRIQLSLNNMKELEYHIWYDMRDYTIRNSIEYSLKDGEMICVAACTRSKWGMALYRNGGFYDYSGGTGKKIKPVYFMRINTEGIDRDKHSFQFIK